MCKTVQCRRSALLTQNAAVPSASITSHQTAPPGVPAVLRLRQRRAPRGLWALIVALLMLQMLGVVHRVVHANRLAPAAVQAGPATLVQRPSSARVASAPAVADGWLRRIFGAEGHADACVLYDQLSHADGIVSVLPLWLPQVWVAAASIWYACWQLAAQAAGFLARGPPLRG